MQNRSACPRAAPLAGRSEQQLPLQTSCPYTCSCSNQPSKQDPAGDWFRLRSAQFFAVRPLQKLRTHLGLDRESAGPRRRLRSQEYSRDSSARESRRTASVVARAEPLPGRHMLEIQRTNWRRCIQLREGFSSFVCLRIRFIRPGIGFLRGFLAFGPNRAVRKKLLLPDRHGPLQRVNGVAACVKRSGPVRRACGNPYTGLAYLDTSETVNDGQAMNWRFCADLRANLAHFSQCHRLVGLVLEVKRAPSLKVVAYEAIKNHDGAVFRTFQILEKLEHLDWLVHGLEHVGGDGCLPAAADRRQKRHFVAIHKRSPPFGIFLIYRSRNRTSKFSAPRKSLG